jgi:hypothetical protein
MQLSSVFDSMANSHVAHAITQSSYMMGALSSVHMLGLTLIVGSSIVVCLRSFGVVAPDQPLSDVMRPAGRAVLLGLAISAVTGLLMFTPRAVSASENPVFQTKMLLVAVAIVFQFTLFRFVARNGGHSTLLRLLSGALGAALWFAVGFYGVLFTVFE